MASLLRFLSWLILSSEAWHGAYAVAIANQIDFSQQSIHQRHGLSLNSKDESAYYSVQPGRGRNTRSAQVNEAQLHPSSPFSNSFSTSTRPYSTILPRHHRLVRRAAMNSNSANVVKSLPSSSRTTPSKPKSSMGQSYNPLQSALDQSKKTTDYSPLKTHVKQQKAIKHSIFNSKKVVDDPLGASGQSSSTPRASTGQPQSNQAGLSRQPSEIAPAPLGEASSSQQSRSRIERNALSSTSIPSPRTEQPPQSQSSSPAQRHGNLIAAPSQSTVPGPTNPANQKGINRFQKGVSLAWDWAGENKLAACTVGIAIAGSCSTIAGVPLVAYAGGSAVAKGIGVGLGVAGRTLGTVAEGTGVAAAIGGYRKSKAISEERVKEIWQNIADKSTTPLKKIPSTLSQSVKSMSDSVKSAGESAFDNLKHIGLKIKNPSEDFGTSPSLDQFTIPEEPQGFSASWSSPAALAAPVNPKTSKFGKYVQMKTFKKGPPNT